MSQAGQCTLARLSAFSWVYVLLPPESCLLPSVSPWPCGHHTWLHWSRLHPTNPTSLHHLRSPLCTPVSWLLPVSLFPSFLYLSLFLSFSFSLVIFVFLLTSKYFLRVRCAPRTMRDRDYRNGQGSTALPSGSLPSSLHVPLKSTKDSDRLRSIL